MRKINIIALAIILLSVFCAVAEDMDKTIKEMKQARKLFRRHMQYAHPRPVVPQVVPGTEDARVPVLQEESASLFINVNAIDSEKGISSSQLMQNESSVAVNPLNTKNLIASAVDYRDTSAAWVYVSHDGGKTWTNIKLGRPFVGWTSSNDPSVAFDPDGNGYMVYGAFGDFDDSTNQLVGENGIFMAKTTDQGYTWRAHIPIIYHRGTQTLDSTFEDKYYITIDNSPSSPQYKHMYIPWKRMFARDSATQIVMAKSTDRGETWSLPVPVSNKIRNTSEDTTYGQSFPLIACGPEGEVYAVWNHGTAHGVGFARSTDGGATFSSPKIIQNYEIFGTTRDISTEAGVEEWRHTLKGKVRAESYPVIATDIREGGRKGYIYLCWAGGNVPDIFFSRSTDGGNNWSTPVVVHSDKGNDQFWPWMNVDPVTGDLMISYFDSRNDSSNKLVECFVSYSSDGGLNWIDRRAADFAHDLSKNPFYGHFAGDYSGLAFYNGIGYPTWVDMRNVTPPYYCDSDVYSAIVNTRVPAPSEDLEVTVIPEETGKLKLTWTPVYKRAFGQPITPDELTFSLFRDGKYLATIEGGVAEYLDEGLTPYKEYHYDLYSVIASDTSTPAIDSGFAGGSEAPGKPQIVSWNNSDNNEVTLSAKLPVFREDGQTRLVNLAGVAIYRNNVFVKNVSLSTADTGKTVEVKDTPENRGWYSYKLKVFDNSQTPNLSEFSADQLLYTGALPNTVDESFEGAVSTSWYENKWGIASSFARTGKNSLTDSPTGNYENNKSTSAMLFPVRIKSENCAISFWHAAIVEAKDTAFFEYSDDRGVTWNQLGGYNMAGYENWQDQTLEQADWKYESFTKQFTGKDIIFRFRLSSSIFVNKDGWYIDDFKVQDANSVEEGSPSAALVAWPNPATDRLFVRLPANQAASVRSVEICDLYGRQVLSGTGSTEENGVIGIDLRGFVNGVYYISVELDNGNTYRHNFLVAR